MRYYVIEISKGDSKIAGTSIYTYDAETQENAQTLAIASYYSKIGTAMKSELYTEHLIEVIDDYGSQICQPHHFLRQTEQAQE